MVDKFVEFVGCMGKVFKGVGIGLKFLVVVVVVVYGIKEFVYIGILLLFLL